MINLPNVTMVCIDTRNHAGALKSIRKSLEQIKPAKTIFLTDMDLSLPGVEVVKIDPIQGKEDYSVVVVKQLALYINRDNSTHVLVIQHDGYVLDGDQWDNEYLNYDYIGAPWPYQDNHVVGNGGFSLRSKKLMNWLRVDHHIRITHPEDEITCRLYGKYLQAQGYKFAPPELACKFSYEMLAPLQPTFGFHQYYHKPYRPVCVVKRSAAAGDVIMTEPLLERLHNDGYQVVLETPRQFWEPFMFHRFPVLHIEDVPSILFSSPGFRVIDLDMAYENKPQQPVLQSYYEKAGITDGVMKNSQLSNYCRPESKLFKKYVVVHIDDTDMPWRNISVTQRDWLQVFAFLTGNGYMVLQVGKGSGKQCGTYINTTQDNFLNFLLGGADLFIGTDSMPLQMAVALGVKCIGFFGSVNPAYRYSDFSRLKVMQGDCPSAAMQHCYHHKSGSTRGQECAYPDDIPLCTMHTAKSIVEAIKEVI